MAEAIAGSEDAFVNLMNKRAKELGMKNTTFVNACGLDADGHLTTARDVAIMSAALIKHDLIKKYSTVWMDSLRGGETELTNTNKLVRFYKGCTGLKTGSTDKAKYCLAATAHHKDMDLIAVIMGDPDPQKRFSDAAILLEYGFSQCSLYRDSAEIGQKKVPVLGAIEKEIEVKSNGHFTYLNTTGEDVSGITKEVNLPQSVEAPAKEGDKTGEVVYYLNGSKIGSVDIVFAQDVDRATYKDYFLLSFRAFLL